MRANVLSIAGFDPSAGAGILADVKTFEQLRVYALAVLSANTFQNDREFEALDWVPLERMLQQLEVVLRRTECRFAKIGIVQNLQVLEVLLDFLSRRGIHVVWDPVLRASAGFLFHDRIESELLRSVLNKIYLLTPNQMEVEALLSVLGLDVDEYARSYAGRGSAAILLKGGHLQGERIFDRLIDGKIYDFEGLRFDGYAKHGSGCILSAAITAYLALGHSLPEACRLAKEYIHKVMLSNKTLLAYHSENNY